MRPRQALFIWLTITLLVTPAIARGALADIEAGESAPEGITALAGQAQLPALPRPAPLSPQQREWLDSQLDRTHLPGPPSPKASPSGGTSSEGAEGPVGEPLNLQPTFAPFAAGTYTIAQDTDLFPVIPSGYASLVGEPCVAQAGRDVLMTGNFYAATSTDGGKTFGFVDPFSAFPRVNAGFCCDQSVRYDPTRNLFLWLLLYAPDATSNTLRLAVAKGQAGFETAHWYWYDFTPQQLGFPTQRWFDYPRLALGANDVYLTANVYAGMSWQASVILRIPLDALAAGGPISWRYFTSTDFFTFAPVEGAGSTMYWASHDRFQFVVHVFRWDEASNAPVRVDVPVRGYVPPPGVCRGPDGLDWCGRADDRIMAGWVAKGVIGFMWNANADATHPYPYVRVIRVNEVTGGLTDEPDLFSTSNAYAYPSIAVNARGHIAGSVFYGGGSVYPSVVGIIQDDLNTTTWEATTLALGNGGPRQNQWGDFLCASSHAPDDHTWLVTGYVLRNGSSADDVHPHLFWVGRQRDFVTTTTTTSSTTSTSSTSSITTTSTTTTSKTSTTATTVIGQTTTSTSSTTTSSIRVTTTTSSTTTSTIPAECGNGQIENDEQCDDGTRNGGFDSCCDRGCRYAATSTPCGKHGRCEQQPYCSGASAVCPSPQKIANGTLCRPAGGECEDDATCDGVSAACPPNPFKSSDEECGDLPQGDCEAPAHCTGSSSRCPAKEKKTSVCRPAEGECDKVEYCDGNGVYCPADELLPAGTPCGRSPGQCEVAATCTGFNKRCPAPAPAQNGDPCHDDSCSDGGRCQEGVCELSCHGDAGVTASSPGRGAPGAVTVTCVLDDRNGDRPASCKGTGYFVGETPSVSSGSDETRCSPGCPLQGTTPATKTRMALFDGGKVKRNVLRRSTQTQVRLPLNSNGNGYLARHPSIQLMVCAEAGDHFGRVRRVLCPAALIKPSKRKR